MRERAEVKIGNGSVDDVQHTGQRRRGLGKDSKVEEGGGGQRQEQRRDLAVHRGPLSGLEIGAVVPGSRLERLDRAQREYTTPQRTWIMLPQPSSSLPPPYRPGNQKAGRCVA